MTDAYPDGDADDSGLLYLTGFAFLDPSVLQFEAVAEAVSDQECHLGLTLFAAEGWGAELELCLPEWKPALGLVSAKC